MHLCRVPMTPASQRFETSRQASDALHEVQPERVGEGSRVRTRISSCGRLARLSARCGVISLTMGNRSSATSMSLKRLVFEELNFTFLILFYTQHKKKVNTYCTLIISYTKLLTQYIVSVIYQIKEKFLPYKDI